MTVLQLRAPAQIAEAAFGVRGAGRSPALDVLRACGDFQEFRGFGIDAIEHDAHAAGIDRLGGMEAAVHRHAVWVAGVSGVDGGHDFAKTLVHGPTASAPPHGPTA